MEGGSTTVVAGAVTFLEQTVLPVGTKLLGWVTSTEGVKEFFYMVLIGMMVGLFNRIRHSFM